MVAPIRFLSGRQQQQKIGIEGGSDVDKKVLEVVGRVGIGTTIFDADYELDVHGDANISGILTTSQIYADVIVTPSILYSLNDLDITGIATVGEDLYVTGNVGIGSTQPTAKLDVNGTLNVSGITTITNDLELTRGSSTSGLTRKLVVGGARSNGSDFATLQFKNYDANSGAVDYVAAEIKGSVPTASNDGGELVFLTAADGSTSQTERLRISSSGNIGIGTENPGELLDVRGNLRVGERKNGPLESNYIAFAGVLQDNQTEYNHGFIGVRNHTFGTENSELFLFKGNDGLGAGSSGVDRVRIGSGEFRVDTYINSTSGSFDSVAASANFVNRLIVDKYGNIGINSTSPTAKLDVNGTLNVTGVSTFQYDGSKKFETTGIGVSISNGGTDTATIAGPENIIIDPAAVGDNTGVVRIKGDLYVDGTTTQINSTTIELADFIVGIATTATTDLLADGAGIQIGADNTFLYEYNSGTNPSLKSSENLNVASGKVYQIDQTERLSANTLSLGTGTTIHSPAGNTLLFGINNTETFRIAADGQIGIGTTNPTQDLDIDGSVRIRDRIYDSNDNAGTLNYVLSSGGPGSPWSWESVISVGATDSVNIQDISDDQIQYILFSPTVGDVTGLAVTTQGLVFNPSSRYIGIGSTTPTANLDIDGDVNVSGIITTNQLSVSGISTDGVEFGNIDYVIVADGSGAWSWKSVLATGAGTLSSIVILDEGALVSTSGTATQIDFKGNNISAIGEDGSGIATVTFSDTPTFTSLNVTGSTGLGTDNATTKLQVGSVYDPQVIGFGTVQGFSYPSTNVLIGDSQTGSSLTPQVGGAWKGLNNNFIGAGAGKSTTTGTGNNFFGLYAGCSNTSGYYNNFFGLYAGCSNTTGYNNVFLGGYNTGTKNTTGDSNNFIGSGAGNYNTTGSDNNFFGTSAGKYNTTGNQNVFIGRYAGAYTTTGSRNIAIGQFAGAYNQEGTDNIFMGRYSGGRLNSPTNAFSNVFIGNNAGGVNTTGSRNVYIGREAGAENDGGKSNVFLGDRAGSSSEPTDWSIFLGAETGGFGDYSTRIDHKVIIGVGTDSFNSNFDAPIPHKGRQLAIGIRTSSLPANYWIVGDENFNIGIGTTNPTAKLDVGGDVNVSGIITALGGFNLGISSSSTSITNNNPVTELNFIGAGNTFALNGTTVDISISGGASVAIGTDAPSNPSEGDLWYSSELARIFVYYDDGDSQYWVDASPSNVGLITSFQNLTITDTATITTIDVNQTTIVGSATSSLSTLTQTAIHTGLSTSTYRSVEYTIQATEGTNFHSTKLLALHNGTTAYHSEYGTIFNNSSVASFDVDISGGNLRLLATGASASQTDYVINFTATKI